MCTVHCNCKPKTLFSAAEVALMLLRIKSKAEECVVWETKFVLIALG